MAAAITEGDPGQRPSTAFGHPGAPGVAEKYSMPRGDKNVMRLKASLRICMCTAASYVSTA